MKSAAQSQPRPVALSEEIIAKCDAPNQFENFDRGIRAFLAVPKSPVLKEEAKAKHRKNGWKSQPDSLNGSI
jgi:hypothetical protein